MGPVFPTAPREKAAPSNAPSTSATPPSTANTGCVSTARRPTAPGGPDCDPEALADTYERRDSFERMRTALDADISAQTVHRWMIEEGIHTPSTVEADATEDGREQTGSEPAADGREHGDRAAGDNPETGGDAGAKAPDDGDGSASSDPEASVLGPGTDEDLRGALTADDLQQAVESASTLYEVQQQLDLDREEARELLAEFDLLELVHGRVADRHRREELKDEIDDRLQANASPADRARTEFRRAACSARRARPARRYRRQRRRRQWPRPP